MKSKPVVQSLAAALVLAAPGLVGSAFAQPARPCNNGVCKVDVSVQSCENGTMAVGAGQDPLKVPSANNIEWSIATSGYKFPADGIRIAGSGFSNNPGANGNGSKFTVHDAWTDKSRDIKYTVKVVRISDNRTCAVWDPIIRNE